MQAANLRKYLFLLKTFRNGTEILRVYRRAKPISRAILWSGAQLTHPAEKGGFVGTILEVWMEQVYTKNFYTPCAGDVVIDAGVHVGLFSILVAMQQPLCTVIAIEPFPRNFACLQANIKALKLSNVHAYLMALSSKRGCGVMRPAKQRSIDHALDLSGSHKGMAVETIGLDDLVQMVGEERIAMCKCDIEGSEVEVFGAVSKANLLRLERIALEYHDNLRAGTFRSLVARLSRTHNLVVKPEPGQSDGLLLATLRKAGSAHLRHEEGCR